MSRTSLLPLARTEFGLAALSGADGSADYLIQESASGSSQISLEVRQLSFCTAEYVITMAGLKLCFSSSMLVVALLWVSSFDGAAAQLANGFYARSCPEVESIVYDKMVRLTQQKNTLPADLLRLHFHDCFVRGCDASVLLLGSDTEQTAPENFRLEGLHHPVNAIKLAVEKACPNTVSCADILAFVARDGVSIRGGPHWDVKGGRRDGRVSKAAEASANLPGADMSVDQLAANFAKQGLTKEDMVHLSGAHTLGDAGCVHIDSRIHTRTDPILPADFLAELQGKCPQPGQRLKTVDLDRQTPMAFDTKYWDNLVERKGLLTSDQALFEDASTKTLVLDNTVQDTFFDNFARAMVKLSEVNVLTGSQGEIRKLCSLVNKE